MLVSFFEGPLQIFDIDQYMREHKRERWKPIIFTDMDTLEYRVYDMEEAREFLKQNFTPSEFRCLAISSTKRQFRTRDISDTQSLGTERHIQDFDIEIPPLGLKRVENRRTGDCYLIINDVAWRLTYMFRIYGLWYDANSALLRIQLGMRTQPKGKFQETKEVKRTAVIDYNDLYRPLKCWHDEYPVCSATEVHRRLMLGV